MTVKAWLEGHTLDLQDLVALFPDGPVRVALQDDRYYLSADEIDGHSEYAECFDLAEAIVARLNGIARVRIAHFRAIRLSDVYEIDGGLVIKGSPVEIRIRASMTAAVTHGGVVQSDPPDGPRYAAIASSDPDVDEALRLMGGAAAPTWTDLYKIHEIIEHSGKLKPAMSEAGISANQWKLFTRTACHPEAAGPEARHSRSAQRPPADPMTLETLGSW